MREPRELEPGRSAADALGAELRRWRVRQGLSQAALGALIHHSGSLVGKVEKGERVPSEEFCAAADAALGTAGALTAMRPAIELRRGPEYECFREPRWNAEVTLRAAGELVEEGAMDRRGFLVAVGAALGGTALTWSASISARRSPAQAAPVAVPRLAERLANLRTLDDELGGTALRDLAVAELRWLIGLTDQHTDDQDLVGLVGEAARLCGWLHLDTDQHAAAQGYYVTALRCSADAGDVLLGANVLAGMAFQATLTGRPREALSLLDVAEQRTRHEASPKLASLLATRRARANARAGEGRACSLALNAAEQNLDRAGADRDEPGWLYFFDEAELAAQAGACWTDLHRPDLAQPLLDAALAGMDPRFVRDRSIYQVRSAQARFDDDEIDQACEELATAATLAARTGSVRAMSTIRDARRSWDIHRHEPAVRTLDASLATLTATA